MFTNEDDGYNNKYSSPSRAFLVLVRKTVLLISGLPDSSYLQWMNCCYPFLHLRMFLLFLQIFPTSYVDSKNPIRKFKDAEKTQKGISDEHSMIVYGCCFKIYFKYVMSVCSENDTVRWEKAFKWIMKL